MTCAACGHEHCSHPDPIFAGIVPLRASPSPASAPAGEPLGAESSPGSAPVSVAPLGSLTGDRDGAGNALPAPSGVNAVPVGVIHVAAAKVGNVAPSFSGAPQ